MMIMLNEVGDNNEATLTVTLEEREQQQWNTDVI